MVDFDVGNFMSSYSPTIGIAFSGGGYRALLSGGGQFAAFDSRTPGSTAAGHLGGLLQSSTYVAGLSGGSWLLGSIVINNFTTIQRLQEDGNVWDFEQSILAPEGALHIVDTTKYYNDLHDEVMAKQDAGFDVSLTDYWARALSRQFVNWTNGGPGVTYSSIAESDDFVAATMPFPIIVADGRNPGELIISSNATVYEYNVFEFGSFDPTLYAFTQMRYLGSNVTNGTPVEDNVCIRGFDNVGFVMGTSSSLFNIIIAQLDSFGITGVFKELIGAALTLVSESENDIADYSPNPFYDVNPEINPSARTRDLTLVDGGLDGQNVPIHPLIQPPRKVDVIFAMDNSADTNEPDGELTNWPNGTAIIATYQRHLNAEMANGTLFPAIPDVNTFISLGLNNRPTFFGCDASNITTDPDRTPPPLIVYIPNSPYSFNSNTSTQKMDYTQRERDYMIENGYNVATQGNGTVDARWHACVGCAIIHRQQERTGATQTAQCQECFQEYCWNGTRATTEAPSYDPAGRLTIKSAGNRMSEVWDMGMIIAAAAATTVGILAY
ncbi:lysophospholipase [Morchella conica CCBAS932]|uniref:Lysophospholipase n=2 Tax=Morchella sect. Distantes TaxID=1051054 RepID=A0A3N4KZ82_9PEZI|nr:lysophospholipase [Morchella conica CCBAS932]